MARNDVYLNINALSPADAVVTGQQDMTAATVPELVLGDTPTFNFYFTDNTNVWPSWAGNAAYTVTWALSDAVSGDFSPAATTGNATPITGGWSIVLPLNAYDLVGLLNTKRVSQPYPVTNLWQQIRVADPSGNEITRAMFWTPVRYRAISDTQNTESASPTGGREVTVDNINVLTTPTAAQFYAANPVPTSALGSAANGELLIGNGTGFTKATLTAGSGVSITNGSGSITISATDGDITLDDGTAAAPSLKFTADTDTGLFRPSDNVVGISAGGVSRATFGATSAINGTTIPGSKTLVVTTDKLSALAATTSAELAGVISDETGTGALVFANTPTLVTPNIGAATGTSVNLSGAGTFGGNLTVSGTGVSNFAGSLLIGDTTSGYQGAYIDFTNSIPGWTGIWLKQTTTRNATTVALASDGNSVVVNAPSGQSVLTRIGNGTQFTVNSTGATVANNLTVSGTGTSSFASGSKLGVGTTSPGVTFVAVGAPATLNYTIGSTSLADIRSTSAAATNAGPSLTFSGYYQTSLNTSTYGAIKGVLEGAGDGNSAAGSLTFLTANAGGALSERARLSYTGNLLLKSDGVDSANGKLQLATHTTSAGGIGFGTDTSLFRSSAGVLTLDTSGGFQGFEAKRNGTLQTALYSNSTNTFLSYLGSLAIQTTTGTTALTLDSSQNATFAGSAGIGGAPSGTYGKLSVHGGLRTVNDTNSKLEIGRYSSGVQNSYIKIGSSSASLRITNSADSVDLLTIIDSTVGGNLGLNTTDQFGSGAGVFSIKNAAVVPSTNPTACGLLYVEAGALKYRGSSGTVTTIANA